MYKELGLKFSQFRIDKGLTAAEVANHSGIPVGSVHQIEEGELYKVKLEHVVAACKVVGCNLNISFVDQKQKQKERNNV